MPSEDFHDPFDNRPADTEFTVMSRKHFDVTWTISKSSRLQSYLNGVLSATHGGQNPGAVSTAAIEVTTYTLNNSGRWYEEACTLLETRTWLENKLDEVGSVYLVVGYTTTRGIRACESTGFDAPGKLVVAVQYRKLKFKLLSSRKVSKGFLEKNTRWKSMWEWR